jgi:hypothetical protein
MMFAARLMAGILSNTFSAGSLPLQAKKHFDAHIIEDGFYGD